MNSEKRLGSIKQMKVHGLIIQSCLSNGIKFTFNLVLIKNKIQQIYTIKYMLIKLDTMCPFFLWNR